MATHELPNPQTDDGSRRRQKGRSSEALRLRAEEAARQAEELRWRIIHSPRQGDKSAAAKEVRAELVLPPGVRRDAGIEHFLQRYNTDAEFHHKIDEAVNLSMQAERDAIIFGPNGKEYVIHTEDGLPATKAAAQFDEMREIRTWAEIEKLALTEKERREEAERARICIYCGKVCESLEALDLHEEECA